MIEFSRARLNFLFRTFRSGPWAEGGTLLWGLITSRILLLVCRGFDGRVPN